MTSPDKPAPGAESMPANEQCVPLAALASDGAAPAEGDAVQYTVKGKLARIEGDKGYVIPETINDQPAGAGPKTPEDMSDDDMMAEAKRADAETES